MSTAQYLPYYPKYTYLDDCLSKCGSNKLYIYVDQKNAYSSIYSEWAVKEMLENSKMSRYIDVSLFAAFFEFINFHKSYAEKRGVELQICFFSERGKSDYHRNLHSTYKDRRPITDMFGLNESDANLYHKILNRNWDLIYKVGNKIPNCSVIRIDYLEADFIPHYIMEHIIPDTDDWCHIIYSNDKDMYQGLTKPNRFQFIKRWKTVKMLDQTNALEYLLKTDKPLGVGAEFIPLVLAIMGDTADGFAGIKGIAEKTIVKNMPDLKEYFYPFNGIYERLIKKEPLFDSEYRTNNKVIQKLIDQKDVIERNIRLASYDMLIDFLHNYPNTSLRKIEKTIRDNVLQVNKRITNGQVLLDSFDKTGISLPISEQIIYRIFKT